MPFGTRFVVRGGVVVAWSLVQLLCVSKYLGLFTFILGSRVKESSFSTGDLFSFGLTRIYTVPTGTWVRRVLLHCLICGRSPSSLRYGSLQ